MKTKSSRCTVVDDAERPLAGVAVSDGRNVVTTDAHGIAELPGSGHPFVWVSRPSGYETADWFRRLAISADGDEQPSELRFVLEPVEQPLPFTFAQLTDLHLSDAVEPVVLPFADSPYGLDAEGTVVTRPLTSEAQVTAALDEVATTIGPHGLPSFVVATGDLTDHGTAAEFAMLDRVCAASPLPVNVIPGNHDHYGHKHDPRPDDEPVDSFGMGTGTTTRYDQHVGPRWWSLTHAGLRIVAIDWFSHRLRLDRDVQEEWLAADLATAPAGTPVLFLTHDQMPRAFFDRVRAVAPHVRVVGSLSGHWHTSRVVRVDGEVHANTGNATFGSFDWAPAHARLFGWDGHDLAIRTVALGLGSSEFERDTGSVSLSTATFAASRRPLPEIDTARWLVRLPGAVHLARPAPIGDHSLVVAWSDDDAAEGGLSCHDTVTGAERWRVALDAPVRAGATWIAGDDGPGVVVAVSISGGVTAVDTASGELRWSVQLGDPMLAWVHAAPVPLGTSVAVGEARSYAALDLADGAVRWSRERSDGVENAITTASGVLQDGTLVTAFSMMADHTFGLDPATGDIRWSGDGNALRSPASDLVAATGGGDVYLTRLGGRVERIAASTGEVRWSTRLGAAFAPGRPLVIDDALFVTDGLGVVTRLDAITGAPVWRADLPGEPELLMGPYRRTGTVTPAGPTLVDGAIVQVSADGRVHRIDAATGAVTLVAATGLPITVPATAAGADAIVATAEGTLVRLAIS